MSKIFSPSIICVSGLAGHRRLNDVLHVGHAHAPPLALLAIDGEFQVRLSLDVEDPHVLDARNVGQGLLHLFGQAFQFVEVRADDLHASCRP